MSEMIERLAQMLGHCAAEMSNEEVARTLIAAMREPTPGMEQAVTARWGEHRLNLVRPAWTTMIDAALTRREGT